MKVGDLVRHKSGYNLEGDPGIVLKVWSYHHDHMQDAGSKVRAMASIHWFHIGRTEPMEHRQDRLEVVSGNRS
jgi:hypothetical protein